MNSFYLKFIKSKMRASITSVSFLTLVTIFATVASSWAQCPFPTAQWPGGTVAGPVGTGTSVTMSTCHYSDDHADVSGLIAGNSYTWTYTGAANLYVTVYNTGGTAIAFGPSPFNWVCPSSGTYQVSSDVGVGCGSTGTTCLTGTVMNNGPSGGCTNPIVAGTVNAPSSGCPNSAISLTLSGTSTGTGLTYQWQDSIASGAWANIAGATGSSASPTLSGPTYYRCIVTCSGGTPAYTPAVLVVENIYACYCIPTTGCGIDYIDAVQFESINNVGTGCAGSGGYNDYTNLSTDVFAAFSYPMSVTTAGDNEAIGVWMDWDQSGTYDASELVYSAYTAGVPMTYNFNVNVPANAVLGQTYMRVRCEWAGPAVTDPCANWTYGETEDYSIQILPTPLFGLLNAQNNPVLCNGDSTWIYASAIGGTAPYTIDWSTSQSTSGASDSIFVGAGTYTITLTDNVGDDTVTTIVINEPAQIVSSASVTQQLVCDYDLSEAQVIASGGTAVAASYNMDTNSANYNWDASGTCTTVIIPIDGTTPNIDIGFDFVFFGDTFDQFQMAANGFIGFGGGLTGNGFPGSGPIPNTATPNNAIYLFQNEIDGQGEYSYCLAGTAPNRRLIANYIEMGDEASAVNFTGQIIIYENSNCIEIQTDSVVFDGVNYVSTEANLQGIESAGGTEAVAFPGRNAQPWEAQDSYVSFCPVDSTGLLYTWSTGQSGSTVSGLAPGTHTVTVSDQNQCSVTHEVTINAPISALTSNLAWENVSCFGVNDGIIDPGITGGSGTMTYVWSNTTQTTATASNLGPGTYSVTAQDFENCTIEVNDVIIWEPSILVSAVTSVEGVICPGDSTGSAHAVATGGIQPYTYEWLPVNTLGQSISAVPNGSYNLKVTDSNGCNSYSNVQILASSTTPIVDLGPDIFDANGGTHILTAGNDPTYTYAWTGGSTGATKSVSASGTYKVTVTNAAGCEGYDEVKVEIWPTGIDNVGNSNLKIYPNPARSFINVEFDNSLANASLNILDLKGAVVTSSTLGDSGVSRIDINNIPSGIYTLNVISGNNVTTHKLVIQR